MDWIVVETYAEGEDGHEHTALDALEYDACAIPYLMRSASVGLLIIIRAESKEEAIELADERLRPDKYDSLISALPEPKKCSISGTVTTIEEARQLAEREVISRALSRNHGKVYDAAKELKISKTTLYRMFPEVVRGQVAES